MDTAAQWLLEQEARSLLSRLALLRPFSLTEPMVQAAAPSDAAITGIERYLSTRRNELRARVLGYLTWLRGPGRAATPGEMQSRYAFLRLRFNAELSQFELFADTLSQRSDAALGTWLAGMDVAGDDALSLRGVGYEAPPVICYVDRGMGAAIRRARTRLPDGGGENPVAIVRMPRERMVGAGIASSLMHEVGHQAAALLDLLPGLNQILGSRAAAAGEDRDAWTLLGRWISEIVADFWAVATVGIASTHGLVSVVALPRAFVFRGGEDDPHPIPWIRVHLSCAIGQALYPHPQWESFAALWRSLYPEAGMAPARRALLGRLRRAIPEFVGMLAGYRPPSLGGRTLAGVFPLAERQPARLLAEWRTVGSDFLLLRELRPGQAFAMIGQAKMAGLVPPEEETRLLRHLLSYWALKRSLDAAASRTPAPRATLALAS